MPTYTLGQFDGGYTLGTNGEVAVSEPALDTAIPDQTGKEGDAFSLDLATYFSGVDTYTITGLPDGTGLALVGSVLSGTLSASDVGTQALTATGTNGVGSATDSFALVVTALAPPVLDTAIPDQTGMELDPFSLDLATYFTGADSYAVSGLPTGTGLALVGSVLSGTMTTDDVGTQTVTVSATNGSGTTSDTFSLDVVALQPPVLDVAIPEQDAIYTEVFSLDLDAYFSGADSYALTGLPAGSGLSLVGSILSGVPNDADVGTLTLTITASNGDGSVSASFTLTVIVEPLTGTVSIDNIVLMGTTAEVSITAEGFEDVEYEYRFDTDTPVNVGTATTFTIIGVPPTSRFLEVRAVSGLRESTWSEAKQVPHGTTPVQIHLVSTNGSPVPDTWIHIRLSAAGFKQNTSGIAVPVNMHTKTDENGEAIVNLYPISQSAYIVTAVGERANILLNHTFFVPESDTIVWLQDLIDFPKS